MGKGDETRQTILSQAAQVFSTHGYFGTSLDDLMQATNLTKGGIYNHFGSKEALAVEAFEFGAGQVRERFQALLAGRPRNTRSRLLALVEQFHSLIETPLFAGGCILLNTAVEADDTNPVLRDRARYFADEWRGFITRTLNKGLELGDVRPGIDVEAAATIIIAALEGGIMLSKLYDDPEHIRRTARHLEQYIESLLRPENPT
ncbi:MAG: TetR/AcrR family transcriptional regulator [Anaerolineae bacterium]|nr:TetR/AcrR family transcriptional regulator [Anaerolineae bacterium]